jgi:hypothetical protein
MFRDSALLTGTVNGARYERENRSENYVEIPPALLITDERGGMWTLGTEYVVHNGEFEFNVLRNDVDTGETAKRIVCRRGKVAIFGQNGWRIWNGKSFV